MNTAKLIAGIVGAAAAGIAVGMILAPEKGSDLRKKIADATDDYMHEIASWAKKGKELVEDAQRMKHEKVDEPVRTASQSYAEAQKNI